MTSVGLLTANLGGFDTFLPPVEQVGVAATSYLFTDENFPPREKSLSPRMQARIPKCFGWEMRPGHDVYVWVDASLHVSCPDTAAWFVAQLGNHEMALFVHPWRATIREEAAYIRRKIAEGNRYLAARYTGEDLDGQLAEIARDPAYVDDVLYASTAFAYRPTFRVTSALKEWWYHISRYHSVDQLALPYVVRHLGVTRLHESVYRASHLTLVRAAQRSGRSQERA
jgi:hypothetical protein